MGTESESGTMLHNQLVSWYTGSHMTHCELYFKRTEESFTVDTTHACVYMKREKTWMRDGWEFWSVAVSREQYERAYRYCCRLVAEQHAFNAWGYYLFFLGPGLFDGAAHARYVCARLVTEVLQEAAVFASDIDPVQMHTGNVLYELQHSTNAVVARHRGKERQVEHMVATRVATRVAARWNAIPQLVRDTATRIVASR